tara:strand:+ start:363 stop:2021 length:1659 start_codon:yes stop_codon:yes gene_type:complete
VIRDGLIVDGTGSEPFYGDIAIQNETIAEIGKASGKAKQEIDAEGALVTPGFIDLHTHFDAQAGWDPALTPISWHGVTTALIGNCGVTFAPCKPKDQKFLANMMESIEDIPEQAILNGLSWKWESYGEYLDEIEKLNPAINLAGLVGHCASRTYVMGERAVDEDPNKEEIEQIAQLVGQSIKEGAVGFSSNRLPGHVLPDGRAIPGTFAKREELGAISKAVGDNNGLLQYVLNYSELDDEVSLIGEQGLLANAPVLFSAVFISGDAEHYSAYDSNISRMRDRGLDITGLTLPRSFGSLSSLENDVLPDRKSPAWRKLADMDFSERLRSLEDSAFRAQLTEEIKENKDFTNNARRWFWLGDQERPLYTQERNQSLEHMAREFDEHPGETWIRLMVETKGKTKFHARFGNFNISQLADFIRNDWVIPGLGDAGAHVSQIIDSGWPTFFLSHWCRDTEEFSIAQAIQKMTSAPARTLGLSDRGTLSKGARADINVIELDNLNEKQPQLVHDFPGGAPRFIQKASGYRATVCNGSTILLNDELTGESGGQIIRSRS